MMGMSTYTKTMLQSMYLEASPGFACGSVRVRSRALVGHTGVSGMQAEGEAQHREQYLGNDGQNVHQGDCQLAAASLQSVLKGPRALYLAWLVDSRCARHVTASGALLQVEIKLTLPPSASASLPHV